MRTRQLNEMHPDNWNPFKPVKAEPDLIEQSNHDRDVYLSYSCEDAEWSEKLVKRLNDKGLSVRSDEWEQPPSHDFGAWFAESLSNCRKLIAVCSRHYFQDEQVQREVEAHLQNNSDLIVNERLFIPVLTDEWEMPAPWSRLRGIDFRNPDDFEFRFCQLMQALEFPRVARKVESIFLRQVNAADENRLSSRQFIEDVKELYKVYDFDVRREERAGSVAADFTITKLEGGFRSNSNVLCIEDRLTGSKIEQAIERIQRACEEDKRISWVVVTSQPLTDEIERKLNQAGIQCKSYSQLLNELIPLESYANKLIEDYESWKSQHWQGKDLFIRPDVFAGGGEEREPALAHVGSWLGDEGESLLVILGDTGSGKSTISKFLACQMAKNYRDDPWRHPAPILVPLGEVRQEVTLKGIIQDHFAHSQTRLADFRRFEYLAGLGRVVLLFDAFDEMASHVREYVIKENLAELLHPTRLGWKVLLTCRTHYFKDYRQQKAMLKSGQSEREASDEALDNSDQRSGEHVVYLAELSDRQVRNYLATARPDSVEADWKKIEEIYNLRELMQHPLLLEMILQSLSALQSGQSISAANLYTVYTNRWVEREEDKERLLPKQFRLKLMTDLAWKMWNEKMESVLYGDLERFVKELAADPAYKIGAIESLDVIGEIQTASFLKREHHNSGDRFSFAHPSFREYFLARKLYNTLLKPESQSTVKRLLQTRLFSPDVVRFVAMLDETDSVNRYLRLVLSDNYAAQVTENALQLLYWGVRFRSGMGENISDVMGLRARLAAYIPRALKMQEAAMRDMVLEAADLQEADFQRADLSNAKFDLTLLGKANFRNADLKGASFVDADLAQSDFTGAKNFDGAVFTNANMSGVKGLTANS